MMPKFRAFWECNHQVAEVVEINYKGNWVCEEPYVVVDGRCDLIPIRECDLMQSTGLKDKNFVEIYEGDIVKPDRGVPFTVRQFIHGQGVFKIAVITSGGRGFDSIYYGSGLEVIGNRYENPELLEGEK